jgi:streptogramin lyase
VAVGGGAIWVGAKDLRGSMLLRISPKTGAVLARVRIPQNASFGETFSSAPIAVGEGAAWAITPDGTLLKIDSATGRVKDKAKLAQGPVTSLATGHGAVWVLVLDPASGNRVLRIDPLTLRVTATIAAPKLRGSDDQAGALAVGEGAVWWNGGNSGTVWRVDPKTRKIDATVRVTPPLESFSDFVPFGIAAGAGGVWVTVTVAP